MNLHVFQTPAQKKHWSVGGAWTAPWPLAADYHVYGLEWDKDEIKYFVDGVIVCEVENTHWHQPLFLIFDSETMPKWSACPKTKICHRPSVLSMSGRGKENSSSNRKRLVPWMRPHPFTLTTVNSSSRLKEAPTLPRHHF